MLPQLFKELLRYNLVGIINTIIGFGIIFSLMFVGVSAITSNMIGYAIGAVLSYVLNKKYTFKNTSKNKLLLLKFFAVLGIAYVFNFLTLQYALIYLNPYLSQIIAAIVYTISSFILAKIFVFKLS